MQNNFLRLGFLLTIFSIFTPLPSTAQIAGGLTNIDAIGVPEGTVSSFLGNPASVGISSSPIAGFPVGSDFSDFLVLSTGDISYITQPKSNFDDPDRSDDIFDLQGIDLGAEGPDRASVILTFPKTQPGPALLKFNSTFLSNEFPEFVGSSFNDFFSATINGGENIAVDTNGSSININNNFFTLQPSGIFFDGQTPPLVVTAPVNSDFTAISLNLTVSDVGDGIYDSAAFVNDIRLLPAQTLYLNFSESTVEFQNKLLPFLDIDIEKPKFLVTPDLVNPGQTIEEATAKFIDTTVTEVKELFKPYNIEIVTEKPKDGRLFSEIAIGGGVSDTLPYKLSKTIPDSVLGFAESVDEGNEDFDDKAIVFTDRFYQAKIIEPALSGTQGLVNTDSRIREAIESLIDSSVRCGTNEGCSIKNDRYQLLSAEPSITPNELARLIVHEGGHLLGLRHVVDDDSILNPTPLSTQGGFGGAAPLDGSPNILQDSNKVLTQTLGLEDKPVAELLEDSVTNKISRTLGLELSDLFARVFDVRIGMPYSDIEEGIFFEEISFLDPGTEIELDFPFPLLDGGLFLYGSSTEGGSIDIFSLADGISNIEQLTSLGDITNNIFDDAGNPILTSINLFLIDEAGNANPYGSINVGESIDGVISKPTSVPESNFTFALMIFGVFTTGSILKRKQELAEKSI